MSSHNFHPHPGPLPQGRGSFETGFTFVSVGNALQPFTRLLEGVHRIAAQLPRPVVVQHGHTPFQDKACQPVAFVGMEEFARYVREADLLIMHAGAGSVIHAVAAGKVPVIMPRRAAHGEHVNDHQVEFARALAEAGKAVVADGPEDLLRAANEALDRQQLVQKNRANTSVPPPLVSMIERVLSEYAGQ